MLHWDLILVQKSRCGAAMVRAAPFPREELNQTPRQERVWGLRSPDGAQAPGLRSLAEPVANLSMNRAS